MNHLLLRFFLETISSSIRGGRIGSVRLLPPVVSIELKMGSITRYLVVIISTPGPFCFLDSKDPTDGTGVEVFRRIRGQSIACESETLTDRVIRLEITSSREYAALVVYLFGSAARVRIESGETIVESLDPREAGRLLSPRSRDANPVFADITPEALERQIDNSPGGKPAISGLSPELLEKFAGQGGTVDAKGLLTFRDAFLERKVAFLLGTRRRAGAVTPLPVPREGERPEQPITITHGPFDDAQRACQEVGESIIASLRMEIIDRHATLLRKHLSTRQRLAAKLRHELTEAESHVACRNEANTLSAYRTRIPPGASTITLPDLYGTEETTTIKLDSALSITEQIQKRFKRAAKLERSRDFITQRIESIEIEMTKLEEDMTDVRVQPSLGDAIRRLERAEQRLGGKKGQRRTGKGSPQTKQYRRFDLDDQWFALVGRNDRENDEITFRVAGPDDIWMHAQQTAGSHVVLKSLGTPGNPPDHILEAAAGIAAHFSKARHASLVPVIYTRRKYVRKFRGSKPGQVLCEREKTIFAAPTLPDTNPGI